jgi:hypothetical protein
METVLPEAKDFENKRIEYQSEYGFVRYYGSLKHRELKTQEQREQMWVGVEWDNKKRGKHNGKVSGYTYFTLQNPCQIYISPEQMSKDKESNLKKEKEEKKRGEGVDSDEIESGGSLLRADHANFGFTMDEALSTKYKGYDEMTEEEKKKEHQLEEDLFVNTTNKGRKKIELVGKKELYANFSDLRNHREVKLYFLFSIISFQDCASKYENFKS